MSRTLAYYASPRIAQELAKVFGNEVSALRVTMRASKDVPRFVRKVAEAHKKAAKSRLKFD
jgi:hypothetical protein